MTKDINTLVEDIYGLFTKEGGHKPSPESLEKLGQQIAATIGARMDPPPREPSLRISNMGTPCERKLWYSVNTPEHGEPLTAPAKIKFLFGDILELLLLFWAREAGHTVEGEQDALDVHGVVGHRDCIIDGRLVDAKSASTYSFKKFASNGLIGDDPFGYLTQLNGYSTGSKDDTRVTEKGVGSFLVIDKTLGNICLDTYKTKELTEEFVKGKKDVLNAKKLPPRGFRDEPEGKSGNRKLGVNCSYCEFRNTCWPGLRTYIYSYGPTYLTTVVREPRVTEAT